ncbi:MAG: type I-E CRISPR-associated protein Cas5/CasD [Chloroflexota bacterium]|nr:type I-E CRISPR-associated protein Cas5/CasD [Chloroflexota bacterium]
MTTLLLRLAGPMQSWGTQSQHTDRDTGMEPSKSGVIGLFCAALGMSRDDDTVSYRGSVITLAELAILPMAVRVEREGAMGKDYHTVGGTHLRVDKMRGYGVAKANGNRAEPVVSQRFYLADADFLVGLEGKMDLLAHLHAALQAPCWQLSLGRKSFVPALPVHVPDDPTHYGPALRAAPLLDVLNGESWRVRRVNEPVPGRLRLVYDLDATGARGADDIAVQARRQDVPISFAIARREYRTRTVAITTIPNPSFAEKGGEPDVSLPVAR